MSDVTIKTGNQLRVVENWVRIYERPPYAMTYGSFMEVFRDWTLDNTSIVVGSWVRQTENRNKNPNLLLRRRALSKLPKFTIRQEEIKGIPVNWVRSLRNAKKLDIFGDDGSSILKMRVFAVPVAKSSWISQRVAYTREERIVAFAMFKVKLPRYHIVKTEVQSFFSKKGKLRYEVRAYPTRIQRLIPTGFDLDLKRKKMPGLRNELYFYQAGESDWRGTYCVVATVEEPDLPGREVFIVEHRAESKDAVFTNGNLISCDNQTVPWFCPLDSSNAAALETFAADQLAPVDALALKRAWKSVATREVNFSTELAQIGQTFQMFVDLTKRLATVLTHLKQGDVLMAAKTLFPADSKALANDFLMFQFGVRPLVEDIRQLATHLTHFLETNAVLHAEGHAKYYVTGEEDLYYYNPDYSEALGNIEPFQLNDVYSQLYYDYEVRVKYSIDLEVVDKSVRDAALWGITAPEETAWELIPFSFVVDWLFNIGDLIEQIHAFDGLVPRETWKTTFIKVNQRIDQRVRYMPPRNYFGAMIPPLPSESYVWRGYMRYGTAIREKENPVVYCKRERIPSLPFQGLKTHNPFSIYHVAEAIALVRQLKS